MKLVFVNLLLALAWMAMTGAFTALNFAFAFVVSGVILLLIRGQLGAARYFPRVLRGVQLATLFVWELIKSSVNVAVLVLSPWRTLRPAIIAYPLEVKTDFQITLLAQLITLTPGTLSIDVSDDRTTLFIHCIDAPDPESVVTDIRRAFEGRILKVFA